MKWFLLLPVMGLLSISCIVIPAQSQPPILRRDAGPQDVLSSDALAGDTSATDLVYADTRSADNHSPDRTSPDRTGTDRTSTDRASTDRTSTPDQYTAVDIPRRQDTRRFDTLRHDTQNHDSSGVDTAPNCDPFGVERAGSCYTDNQCRCGLQCARPNNQAVGMCVELCQDEQQCDDPTTPICAVSGLASYQLRAEVATYEQNICLSELSQFRECSSLLAGCGEDLTCYPSSPMDEDNDGVYDLLHCQQLCPFGEANACGLGQTCNASRWVETEPNSDGSGDPITCVESDCLGSSGSCPCSDTYNCGPVSYAEGPRVVCHRRVGVCGTAVNIVTANELDNIIQTGEIPSHLQNSMCDPANGVLCLSDPGPNFATTDCLPLFQDAQGFCLGVCAIPQDDGQYEYLDCPGNMGCIFEPVIYQTLVRVGGDTVACTDDTDCEAYPNSACRGPFSSTGNDMVCARAYGICGDAVIDAGIPDTAVPDTAAPDRYQPDNSTPDTGLVNED